MLKTAEIDYACSLFKKKAHRRTNMRHKPKPLYLHCTHNHRRTPKIFPLLPDLVTTCPNWLFPFCSLYQQRSRHFSLRKQMTNHSGCVLSECVHYTWRRKLKRNTVHQSRGSLGFETLWLHEYGNGRWRQKYQTQTRLDDYNSMLTYIVFMLTVIISEKIKYRCETKLI
jgi:hypothetical protein